LYSDAPPTWVVIVQVVAAVVESPEVTVDIDRCDDRVAWIKNRPHVKWVEKKYGGTAVNVC
jgi:hypothetical protein